MAQEKEPIDRILDHIQYLATILGGRGSCTPVEKRAAEYTVEQMAQWKVQEARVEAFDGAPATYRGYGLAFGLATLGTLLAWLAWMIEEPLLLPLAVLLNALAAWGVLAESDLAPSWLRWASPKAESHNAVGVCPPVGQVERRAVLCAHLDSHRTPFFYASKRGFVLFRVLMIASWLTAIAEAILYALALVFGWQWVYWVGAVALVQILTTDICLRADTTPFSPGANDNASGVGTVLELARRLQEQPLARTEVWLAFTGCEETGAAGIRAFLDTHGERLGDEAVYVILDMVGQGRLNYLTSDGLLIKHKTHARALDLARRANDALADVSAIELTGLAYTDALVATKRGKVALTINTLPAEGEEEAAHWHRMSDTMENLDLGALEETYAFTWQVLQEIDKT